MTNQRSWKVSKGHKNSGSEVGKGGRQDCQSQAVGTTVFFYQMREMIRSSFQGGESGCCVQY